MKQTPFVLPLLSTREKLEENLVNNMETTDNDLGADQSAASHKPTLMFRIASKRKKRVTCCRRWRVM